MLIYTEQIDPPLIEPKMYTVLLHQDNVTYRRMQTC